MNSPTARFRRAKNRFSGVRRTAAHQRVRDLIQSALHHAPVFRPGFGRRKRLHGVIVGGRSRRRDRRRCDGGRRRRFVAVLVGDELVVAGSTRPRRNVLGHTAGPSRPIVGDISGERRACPERQTGAEQYRCSEQPLDHSGRQKLRLDGSDLWVQSTIVIADRPILTPAALGKAAFMAGLCQPQGRGLEPRPKLLSLWYQGFANGAARLPQTRFSA